MIDLHSHILPGLDDGASTMEASLEIARGAVADGITIMLATPHVNGRYTPEAAEIRAGAVELNARLASEGIPLVVSPGAEIAVSELSTLNDEALSNLALGGSTTLLIESPYADAAPFLDRMLFDLQARGFRVLLAHPERSALFGKHSSLLVALVERGIMCSITAGSLAGRFGRRVRSFALELVEHELVHNVSSDAHNSTRRPPGLSHGFERADRAMPGIRDMASWLTDEVPSSLLSDSELPPYPELGLRLSRRRGLKRRIG